jgi:hypothetical protein
MLCSLAHAQTPLPEDDSQFWSEAQLSGTLIKDKVDLTLWEFWRHGRDFSFPTDLRSGVGLTIKVNKHLIIQPSYLYFNQRPWPGVKNLSHRLVVDTTTIFNLGKFGFTNRHRFERQLRHANPNDTQLRERLTIDHPVHIGDIQFKVFVSDEIFYSRLFKEVYRNRIAVGVSKTFNPRFYAELFYLRQNDGRSRPGDIHALGTVLKIRLWD